MEDVMKKRGCSVIRNSTVINVLFPDELVKFISNKSRDCKVLKIRNFFQQRRVAETKIAGFKVYLPCLKSQDEAWVNIS